MANKITDETLKKLQEIAVQEEIEIIVTKPGVFQTSWLYVFSPSKSKPYQVL